MKLVAGAWEDVQPLLRMLLADGMAFLAIWLLLFFVHLLSVMMPVGGPVGKILVAIHEYGLVLIYVLLSLFTAYDVIKFKLRHNS